MRVYYSPDHRKREAMTELYGGRLIRPFESPERMDRIVGAVKAQGHDDIVDPPRYGLETARHVHDRGYLEFLSGVWQRWRDRGFEGEAIAACFPARRMRSPGPPRDIEGAMGYYSFSADTSITEGTYEAARRAMDCALAGADDLAAGAQAVFAACRPPGHHASIDQFGGYCFLNNAAIAAQRLIDHGIGSVGLLDMDFHHGNGTQDIFYHRGDVFFASIHGDPSEAFPHFLGHRNEVGLGAGEGRNANYPLPPGTGWENWGDALDDALSRICAYGAQMLVVSLGVDAYELDPISFFKLTSDDFLRCGDAIGKTGLPVLFCMEGGYGVEEIGLNAANVLTACQNA